MHKKSKRFASLFLCFLFIFSFSLSASALTVSKKQTKVTYCTIITYGDSVIPETATVTFTNTSNIPVRIEEVSESGCTSYLARTTIQAGNKKSFKIKTNLWKTGKVKIKVTPLHDGTYTYTITGKNTNTIGWSYS